jgi:hypothetical protein
VRSSPVSSTHVTAATRALKKPGPRMDESFEVEPTRDPMVASPISGEKEISLLCVFLCWSGVGLVE